jgi:hypothetical protein
MGESMTRLYTITFSLFVALLVTVPVLGADEPNDGTVVSIEILPKQLNLSDAMHGRRLVVIGKTDSGHTIDLSTDAQLEPADKIVKLDADGFIVPVADGKTTIKVTAGDKTGEVPITVGGMDQPRVVSFVRDVMPAINKAGCTAGACHGAAKGKNGFKLSLRGYDQAGDYRELVDDASARRFNRSDPGESLMLLKPTQGVPHEGGLVFEPGSRYYNVIRDWIAAGLPNDAGQTQLVERIEVVPESPLMHRPGLTRQCLVTAFFPDGGSRDVTREAFFESSKPIIADVDKHGRVTAVRPGEAAILVRYEGRYGISHVTVLRDEPGFVWADVPVHNYIDTHVNRKLERMHILPSALCDDATFIRRVSLDLTGLPPTAGEVEAFLHDGSDTRLKRQQLVDALMDRPAFVDHWANKWADLLQNNRKHLGEKGIWIFRNWLRDMVRSNLPFDTFVRQLITGVGSTYDNPATSYLRVSREPDVASENTTQLFLGVRFMCCKCHDHPFERWTQNDYYGLAAYFAQVGRKKGARDGEEIIYERRDGGEVMHPKGGQVVPPSFPFPVDGVDGKDAPTRRAALAAWLTSPDNPYFAKSVSNRIFSYFSGRGIIEPVDDIRASNPASNPALLDALSADFKDHGFDVRHLIRTIVTSRTYQLSVETNEWNAFDNENFSHASPRRLGAEQLLDAITVATGRRTNFKGVPASFRAAQLPDGAIGKGGFLDLFGRPPRESSCECERRTEVSFAQALNLVNGPTIAEAVSDPQGQVAKLAANAGSDAEVVDGLYLSALCRKPTPAERDAGAEHIASAESRAEGAQDLMWALLNSPAFLFNR